MSRIVTNTSALTVFKSLSRNTGKLAGSAERLATGLRINRASDDAAGLAISETMRAQIKGADMAVENINNAVNFINTAEGYLQNISDVLGRMEELAVQYKDDTKSTDDKANINVEFQKLASELDTIVSTRAKFNSASIFGSTAKTLAVGPDGGQTFTIAGTDLDMASNTGFSAVSGSGKSLASNVTVGNVQTAITQVSKFRATLGSYQSQLQFTMTGLQNYSENISASESRIRNVDVAKEATNFSRYQIQVQAGTAMLAQANALPQSVLSLLG